MHKTILKPVEIFSAALDHNPTLTPSWANTKAQITICFGEFASKRALKAGITSNAPISKEPTARKAKTVNKANKSMKIRRCQFALTPSLTAMSGSIAN
ncbi:hypothetical protein D9M73_188320 [compost metagenome]